MLYYSDGWKVYYFVLFLSYFTSKLIRIGGIIIVIQVNMYLRKFCNVCNK